MKALVIKLAVLLIAVGSLIAAGSADAAKDPIGLVRPTPTPDRYANTSYNSGTDDDEYIPNEAANTANISEDDPLYEISVNTAMGNVGLSPDLSDKDKALIYFIKAKETLDQSEEPENILKWQQLRREAVRFLTAALSLDPHNRTYLLERGQTTDVPEVAIEDLTNAIKMNPKDPEAYIYRAKVYADIGDHDSALADYQKAIDLDPDDPTYYRERALFFEVQINDPDRELADLNKILKLDPNDTLVLRRRAEIFRDRKDYVKALTDQNLIVKLSPRNGLAFIERAETYKAMGKFKEAIADCTSAIELYPEDSSFRLERADLYRKTGRPDLALKDEKKVEELEAKYKKLLSDESWDEK